MLSEDSGRELLDEMKYGALRTYNAEGVDRVNREIHFVQNRMDELKLRAERSQVTQELSINFALLKAYKERSQRILRAYVFSRLAKIADNYFNKEEIKNQLSVAELEFDRDCVNIHEEILESYKHLDIFSREPPLDFYVQVMTLEDCGVIMSGDGFIDLKKDRLYFLRKADIAHLITSNSVKIL